MMGRRLGWRTLRMRSSERGWRFLRAELPIPSPDQLKPYAGSNSPPTHRWDNGRMSPDSFTSPAGYDLTPLTSQRRDDLAARLSEEERRVLIDHGTEPPFCGGLLDNKEDGLYACRLCSLPLFKSNAKFESGTGWPSFFQPFEETHIREIEDTSYGMRRIEIRCARCDGHLGHVFPDGPQPTGQRYCLNSASLEFFEEGSEPAPDAR